MKNSKAVRYVRRSLPYLRQYWKLAVWSVAVMLLSVAVALLLPWPLKFIFDNVLKIPPDPLPAGISSFLSSIAGDPFHLLMVFVFLGFVLVLAQNLLTVLASYVNTTLEQSMTLDFRSQMFQHVLNQSMTFHDQRRSGMIMYAINSMCDGVPRLLMAVPPLAQNVLTLVGMFCVLLCINFYLAFISITIVPFLYYSIGYYVKYIQPRLYHVRGLEGESLSIVHEAISMTRVIVAFVREAFEFRRFRNQGQTAIDARIQLTVKQTLFSLTVNTITAAGSALVLGFGAYEVLQGKLSAGDLLVAIAYIASVYHPLEVISTTIGSLQDVFVSLDMAFGIMDARPEIQDAPGAVALKRARGHIVYKGVEFSYIGRVDTLKNVSFEARPGQVIAVVGQTGAGKTTLVSLLPRFYDSNRGKILIDGHDIKKLTLQSLRRQVSIVLQEPLLFSGSIADNIRYGRLEAGMEEIIEAAQSANAHDFIMQMPQGYNTELGERGAKLSGGERQRLCVARAFLKDAPILILDEPTSSIDSKTEAVILDALDRLMDGRTTFMIAHRLSTVRKADLILVVDQGQIVEQGTHEQLLVCDGLYKQLYDLQNKYVRNRKRL